MYKRKQIDQIFHYETSDLTFTLPVVAVNASLLLIIVSYMNRVVNAGIIGAKVTAVSELAYI